MRRMMLGRFTLYAAAGALAVVTLGACGSDNASPAAPVHNAPAKVTTVADLASLVTDKTPANTSAHITFTATTGSMGSMSGSGAVKLAGADSAMSMTASSPVGDIGMVMADRTLYIKIPAGEVKTAKPWIRIDANGTDALSKAFGALLSQEQQSMNPGAMLGQLKSVATIRSVSGDTVAGRPATHYAITIDTNKLMASPAITDQLKQVLRAAGTRLPATIDYDLWLNGQNLPVKAIMTQPVQGQNVTMTITFSDWGTPVTITPPPADQVGPLPHN